MATAWESLISGIMPSMTTTKFTPFSSIGWICLASVLQETERMASASCRHPAAISRSIFTATWCMKLFPSTAIVFPRRSASCTLVRQSLCLE